MSRPLAELSALGIIGGYLAREFTPAEVLADTLLRARTLGVRLGLFTSLAEISLQHTVGEVGARSRLLAGIPVSAKDDLFVQGLPVTGGSPALRLTEPVRDSVAIARLRAAGAVFFGKTNLSELAMTAEPGNRRLGPIRNPWEPSRAAGASSGGAAAAVAAGIGPIAIATDTGGSIRYPAALCGVYGFATSNGRVPRFGNLGANHLFCSVGALARSAADLALPLQAMSGPHGSDPESLNYPYNLGTSGPSRHLRLGWLQAPEGLSSRVVLQFCEALCREKRWTLQEVNWALPPDRADFQDISDCDRHAMLVATGRLDIDSPHLSESVRARLERGSRVSGTRYSSALEGRRRFIESLMPLFDQVDLLVQPTCAGVAPLLDSDCVSSIQQGLSTLWWTNLAGCCAANVPAGLIDGLPVGLHMVGRPGADELLLHACMAVETAFGPAPAPAI